jgi:antitoxin (DNA-binding transcriptional repressor) of toxin-antitoxin stability system
MEITFQELKEHLAESTLMAWSGVEMKVIRDGKPIATLVHRGPQFPNRNATLFAEAIPQKRMAPLRSRHLSDLGLE